MRSRAIVLSCLAALAATRLHAAVIYVKPDAAGPHDGTSWATAFTTIQPALDAAQPGDEVWVAAGTYKETLAFRRPNVALYGGFAGNELSSHRESPWERPTVIDAGFAGSVVTVPVAATDAVIDGFTITRGSGTVTLDDRDARGGGILVYGDRAVVTRNVVQGNRLSAKGDRPFASGAGIHVSAASVTISGNTIRGNFALADMGMYSIFTGGWAEGGGVALHASNVVVANNLFDANETAAVGLFSVADTPGTALFAAQCTGRIVNNTCVANRGFTRPEIGWPPNAAVHLERCTAELYLVNNVVAQNTAGIYRLDSGAFLIHNLIHGNGADVTGPDPIGTLGNFSADPLFANPANGDFHLQPLSPCIDAGDDAAVIGPTDLDANPRIIGPHVDLGCYEATIGGPCTVGDAASALRVAAGLNTATGATFTRLDVDRPDLHHIDFTDAIRVLRRVNGLE